MKDMRESPETLYCDNFSVEIGCILIRFCRRLDEGGE